MEEGAMEYSELVEYYKGKLLERYKATLARPEMAQIREKLENADEETLREVLKLLER
jgi:glutamyl-tRNA reductase